MEIAVGLRVVRGPDWKWGNQDDGEGHVGTVAEVGRNSSSITPEKTVIVIWDSGQRTNYRVGYQSSFDLRVYDSAPVGVRHANVVCMSCKRRGIVGMRWKCLQCPSFDLCSECYHGDKHNLDHAFVRFDTPNTVGVEVPKRNVSVRVQAKGIFVGARVVRGFDWDWDSQDGGEGEIGKVVDIRGWDTESHRSVAKISWVCGNINVYRVGHKGKVDLKYVRDGLGGNYYRDHLPVLGKIPERSRSGSVWTQASPAQLGQAGGSSTAVLAAAGPDPHELFTVGDTVKVIIEDIDNLISLQHGHGGWNPKMAEFLGKMGRVHRVTDRGDIRVQFEGSPQRWTFNPTALCKQPTPGDTSGAGPSGVVSDDSPMTLGGGMGDMGESSNSSVAIPSADNMSECIICLELALCVELRPCGHRIVCEECSVRMKKCIQCGVLVTDKRKQDLTSSRESAASAAADLLKSSADSHNSPSNRFHQIGGGGMMPQNNCNSNQFNKCPDIGTGKNGMSERLKYLEHKIAEFEEFNQCNICMERVRNVVFLCGHGACVVCAEPLKICHMCRKSISSKINIY